MVPPPRKRQKRLEKGAAKGERLDFVSKVFSKELVLKVFSFLSSRDLIQCAAVSLHWSRMANDEMLWKPLFMRRFRDPLLIEDKRTKLHFNRRASVSRYDGSWKTKYRIHHNWLLGNCAIQDIVDAAPAQHLQFLHDIVFIVEQDGRAIQVYKYKGRNNTLPLLLDQLESMIQPKSASITCLKLVEKDASCHLIAGYSNGGFTLWQVVVTAAAAAEITEIASYTPSKHSGKVVSLGMDFPMILLYTEGMRLSVFRIGSSSLTLIHHLQSPMGWSPVAIDIQRYPNNKRRELWKALICFGLSGGSYTTSVGVQEIVLSSDAILSSKHGFASNSEPMIPSSLTSSSSTRIAPSSETITSMSYAPPHLITAHPNNTMKHYVVKDNKDSLDITFKQTLYGHTFKVDALAIDAARRKLVSGDRSGIKIWDLVSQRGECQVALDIHSHQSAMDELPNATIHTLGFDEDKIVAIVSLPPDNNKVRSWSFDV